MIDYLRESMNRLSSLVSLAGFVALFIYLVVLTRRTSFFERTAAVGADVAIMVAVILAISVLAAVIAFRTSPAMHFMSGSLIAMNLALTLVYLLLYMTGRFGPVGLKL